MEHKGWDERKLSLLVSSSQSQSLGPSTFGFLLKQRGPRGWAMVMATPGKERGVEVKSELTLPKVKIHSCMHHLTHLYCTPTMCQTDKKILAFLKLTV